MPDITHLRVYPNPWFMLDHNGLPCGTVPFDPVHGGGARRWVGASIASAVPENKPRVLMTKRQKGGVTATLMSEEEIVHPRWAFELTEPTLLPVLPCYLGAIRNGELIAADADTAALAGTKFVARDAALLAAFRAGVAKHERDTLTTLDVSKWPESLNLSALRADAPAETAKPAAAPN
jgi:hypothetical protein